MKRIQPLLTRKNILLALAGIVTVILLLGAIVHFSFIKESISASKPLYVAVMLEREYTANTTSPFPDSLDARRGIDLCTQEINESGISLPGGKHHLEIDYYYDENNAETAQQRGEELLAQNRALVVLGHAQSPISQKMGQVYAQNGIPAITASSLNDEVTTATDWYFRVLPNSTAQAYQMAHYIYHVLGQENVTILELNKDAFAQSITRSFQSAFDDLGGNISYHYHFDGLQNGQMTPEMQDIVAQIKTANREFAQKKKDAQDPGVLIFFMRAPEGANFLVEMRNQGVENLAFGPSSFANLNFLSTFRTVLPASQEIYSYSNGVYVLAPVVYDTAGDEGRAFLQRFRETYQGEDPGMKAATNCDALKVAVQAIENAKISGDSANLAADRQKLRDALAAIDTPTEAVEGVTGKLYFDKNRNPVKPIDTSIYQNGQRISAISQVVEITRQDAEWLMSQKTSKNSVLQYDNRYFRLTDVAYIGIDINQVSELDVQTGTYTVDFYLWFRAREPMNPEDFEFLQAASVIEYGDPVVETVENGISYRAYHVQASFKGDFRYNDYPFDAQIIGFDVKHKFKNAQELLIVPDTIGMRGITATEILDRLRRQNAIAALGDWNLGDFAQIQQSKINNNSTLGNPDLVGRDTNIPYSRVSFNFEIVRDGIKYSLKNLLPLFFLLGLAQLAFFSSASDYGKMYDIVTSVILTAAFFQLGLTESLPNIGYTTAMDWMFYMLYLLCILQIVVILVIKTYIDKSEEAHANKIVFISRWAYPLAVIFGGYVVYLMFWTS